MDKTTPSDCSPPEGAAALEEGLLEQIRELGGAARTIEVVPHALVRKVGLSPTAEIVERVHGDLAELERRGVLLVGEGAAPGVMVMLLTCTELPVVLTCERLVTLYGWMNEHERAMLTRWESVHLSTGQGSTADWPGWPTIYKRRYS